MNRARRRLDIAVGILRRPDGAVLINQRRPGTHFAGWWEFPGGKFECGESVTSALYRELEEELGIRIGRSRPLITVNWDYPERQVRLHTRIIENWWGRVEGCEGQAIAWVKPQDMSAWQLLPADLPIVNALRLPARYLITPDPAEYSGNAFLASLERSLEADIRLVRLRAYSLAECEYRGLASDVIALTRNHGADLLLDRDSEMVGEIGAQGLHLTGQALRHWRKGDRSGMKWLAASCHGPSELSAAQQAGADFCVLSPVRRSPGHSRPLGWHNFARWADRAAIPVYALGGLDQGHIAQARGNGAQGIAAIRGCWVS